MSATGLDVFDRTLQTTNIWLDDIMAGLGPDRHLAWHVLGAVLHALRDRLPLDQAAHLGAQLPLLVRVFITIAGIPLPGCGRIATKRSSLRTSPTS